MGAKFGCIFGLSKEKTYLHEKPKGWEKTAHESHSKIRNITQRRVTCISTFSLSETVMILIIRKENYFTAPHDHKSQVTLFPTAAVMTTACMSTVTHVSCAAYWSCFFFYWTRQQHTKKTLLNSSWEQTYSPCNRSLPPPPPLFLLWCKHRLLG